jgi:hypothetical protein
MSEMRILDLSGDTKIIWDADRKDEVDNARESFDRLTKKGKPGYLAFEVKKGKPGRGRRITEFDPEAERLILSPPIVGG